MAKKRRAAKKTGWARTKRYPLKRHPAYYKRQGKDDIQFVTFTHSDEVKFDNGERERTMKLNVNINRNKKGEKDFSHVVPRVYEGKRSALGEEVDEYRLSKEDYDKVDSVFKTGKVYPVPYTSNSKKKKP